MFSLFSNDDIWKLTQQPFRHSHLKNMLSVYRTIRVLCPENYCSVELVIQLIYLQRCIGLAAQLRPLFENVPMSPVREMLKKAKAMQRIMEIPLDPILGNSWRRNPSRDGIILHSNDAALPSKYRPIWNSVSTRHLYFRRERRNRKQENELGTPTSFLPRLKIKWNIYIYIYIFFIKRTKFDTLNAIVYRLPAIGWLLERSQTFSPPIKKKKLHAKMCRPSRCLPRRWGLIARQSHSTRVYNGKTSFPRIRSALVFLVACCSRAHLRRKDIRCLTTEEESTRTIV